MSIRQHQHSGNGDDEKTAKEQGGACDNSPFDKEREPLEPETRQPIGSAFWDAPLSRDEDTTREQAVQNQYAELRGRVAATEANGWQRNSRKKYRRIVETDRRCQSEFTDLTTCMLSLRQSPQVSGEWVPPLALLRELSETVRSYVIPALRRAISHDFEYCVVLAGTENFATPHAHVYLWIDGTISPEAVSHVVEGYTDRCKYAPDDGTGNALEDVCTVQQSPQLADEETYHRHNERGFPTRGAVYVASQIPNVAHPDEASEAALLHGAVADRFEKSAAWLSQGSTVWRYGDEEPVVAQQDNLSAERFRTDSADDGADKGDDNPHPQGDETPSLSEVEREFVEQYLSEVGERTEQRICDEIERNIRKGKLPPETSVEGVVQAIQQGEPRFGKCGALG